MEAIALYRGDFMHGFSLRDNSGFEGWVLLQREALRRQVESALERLILAHIKSAEPDLAIPHAQRLLALNPMNERAHRYLMRLYTSAGRRSEALKQYELCVKVLLEELGVRPEEETTRLHATIRTKAGSMAAVATPGSAPPAPKTAALRPEVARYPGTGRACLPMLATRLVGRRRELALITERLEDPTCRLLTLTGPGGVGKSSLALEAARRIVGAYRDGAAFVPLTKATSPGLLVSTIADAIELPSAGHTPLQARLFEHLRDRQMLLVLDGFEHLLEAAGLLAEILPQAAEMKILVTSRERLHLRGEWDLVVHGLPYTSAGQPADAGDDATELFIQTAVRADAAFTLTAENALFVTRICGFLGGVPLGIELAASWVRHFNCQEIAARIEQNLDFLVAPRDAPERQQSLRATFIHSWRLLSDIEKSAMRRMSVFRGGASESAALEIAGSSLAVLTALTEKFLVHRGPEGRYELHELIRQYAFEALEAAPDDHARTDERHAAHYTTQVEVRRRELQGPHQERALRELAAEMGNISAAIHFCVERARHELLDRALDGLCALLALRGEFREALAVLREATVAVRRALGTGLSQATGDRLRLLLGRLLARRGQFALDSSARGEASSCLSESLRILREQGAQAEISVALCAAGRLALLEGNDAAARVCFEASCAISEELGDKLGVASALRQLSAVACRRGHKKRARRLLEDSLSLFRSENDSRGVAGCFVGLGSLLELTGDLDGAESAYRAGISALQEIKDPYQLGLLQAHLARVLCRKDDFTGSRSAFEACLSLGRRMSHLELISLALHGLGVLSLGRGDYEAAERFLDECARLCDRSNSRRGLAESLHGLGRVTIGRQTLDRARHFLSRGLKVAMEAEATTLSLDILVSCAELSMMRSASPPARKLLSLVLAHPSAEPATRQRADLLLGSSARRSTRTSKRTPLPRLLKMAGEILDEPSALQGASVTARELRAENGRHSPETPRQ
jgi:predicted ATPase